jgi:hypothetical protein
MNYTEKGLLHTILGEYASMVKARLDKYNGVNSITDELKIKLEMADRATEIIRNEPLTEWWGFITLSE